jgi:peptidoglycan/LPS O-acetylase OafA/YrhL
MKSWTKNIRAKLLPGDAEQSSFANLDGLRAIACLLVISAHSLFAPESCGATGVWLFFALSGFLLYRSLPTALSAWSIRYVFGFLTRRILRIYPLYVLAVVVYGLLWRSDNHFFVDHWFLIDAKTFFWTVKTEMLFYLILPFLGLLLAFVKDDRLKACALLALGIAYRHYVEIPYAFVINAAVTQIPLYLSPFLLGMACSAVSHRIRQSIAPVLTVAAAIGIVVFCVGFAPTMPLRQALFGVTAAYNVGWHEIGFASALCAALVSGCARLNANAFLTNILVRSFGLFGYSVYLWHILVLTMFREFFPALPSFAYLGLTLLFVYPVAAVSFMFIERPFILLGRRIASRSIAVSTAAMYKSP